MMKNFRIMFKIFTRRYIIHKSNSVWSKTQTHPNPRNIQGFSGLAFRLEKFDNRPSTHPISLGHKELKEFWIRLNNPKNSKIVLGPQAWQFLVSMRKYWVVKETLTKLLDKSQTPMAHPKH